MTALKEVLWTFQVKDAANQDLALIGCHHNVKNVQQDVLIAHFKYNLYILIVISINGFFI
jgi:hypothetical protein